MPDDELEKTAYHEAGHVVMAIQLGGTVSHASLEPPDDDGPGRFGETITRWPTHPERKLAYAELCVSMAGPAAEMIHAGETVGLADLPEWRVDYRQAVRAVARLSDQKEEFPRILAGAMASVKEFIKSERGWAAVAAVADLLLAHGMVEHDSCLEVTDFWLNSNPALE
ncbi:MAG: hypothetical protein VYE64_00020 [Planctomycetota bacterium]|nr:hypothetical protein [Planctomycetota bacterium]